MTILSFDQGTLLLDGLDQPVGQTAHMTPPGFILDFLLLTAPVITTHTSFIFSHELKFNSTIIRSKPSRPGGGWISAA